MAMKQNNFYLRWQKAAGAAKSEQRSRSIRTAAPGIAVVAAALLGWGAMTLYTASLTSQRQDIVNWCNDNSASVLASSQDAEPAAQFRALTQGLARRHKLVTDHEKLVGDAEERVRVSLHGSSLSEQGQQAAPAVQGNAACVRDIALIKSPLGRRQEIDDSPAVFRCGTDEQLHDAFFDGFFGLELGRNDSCSGWASGI